MSMPSADFPNGLQSTIARFTSGQAVACADPGQLSNHALPHYFITLMLPCLRIGEFRCRMRFCPVAVRRNQHVSYAP